VFWLTTTRVLGIHFICVKVKSKADCKFWDCILSSFVAMQCLYMVTVPQFVLQVAFYEILCGMWVRNGLQIKGQAMTYIQCNFCNSMVDADLYLLQICATQIPSEVFLTTVMEK